MVRLGCNNTLEIDIVVGGVGLNFSLANCNCFRETEYQSSFCWLYTKQRRRQKAIGYDGAHQCCTKPYKASTNLDYYHRWFAIHSFSLCYNIGTTHFRKIFKLHDIGINDRNMELNIKMSNRRNKFLLLRSIMSQAM